MAGQLCGRCGGSLTDGGCGCAPTGEVTFRPGQEHGPGTDTPTAIIPVVNAPELVRPYITPTDVIDAEVLDEEHDPGYGGGSVVPGIDSPHLVRSSRARVLAGQLVEAPGGPDSPGRRGTAGAAAASTELVPSVRVPVHRGRAARRSDGRGRRTALIGVGALLVAGLGTAAALAGHMLNGDGTDLAQPQPGVTMALPTAAPDADSGASPATTGVRPSRSAPARTSAPPATRTATPSATADSTPSSQAPHNNAPNSPPPSTAAGHPHPSQGQTTQAPAPGQQSLKLGDRGAAVATLQSELSQLWVDRDLPATGTFDNRTQQDVATFQVWYGVHGDPSGVFGPNSQARMNQLFHHH